MQYNLKKAEVLGPTRQSNLGARDGPTKRRRVLCMRLQKFALFLARVRHATVPFAFFSFVYLFILNFFTFFLF